MFVIPLLSIVGIVAVARSIAKFRQISSILIYHDDICGMSTEKLYVITITHDGGDKERWPGRCGAL
jgi:hypothetical protein